jgi:hypothetical protein
MSSTLNTNKDADRTKQAISRSEAAGSGAAGGSTSPSSRSSSVLPGVACPTLTELCLAHFGVQLDQLGVYLPHLPEELVQHLLFNVVSEGRLTPRLVKLFRASQHDSIVRWLNMHVRMENAYVIPDSHSCR